MENFIYRRAVADDIPQIAKVHVESWQKSFRGIAPQEYLDNLSVEKREYAFRERFGSQEYQIVIAETVENKIVGFADFGEGRGDQPEFGSELYAIYLLREFQGNGIGSNLFKMVANNLRENGFNSIYLQALKVSPYRNFYEKMGGEIIGESLHKLGNTDFITLYYGWKDLRKL